MNQITDIFNKLTKVDSQYVEHVYQDAIKNLAKAHIRNTKKFPENQLADAADKWLNEIWRDSFPGNHHLISILGESDLFAIYYSEHWSLFLNLVDNTCPFASEIEEQLQQNHNFKTFGPTSAVDLIEDLFAQWQRDFLVNVCVKTTEIEKPIHE